MKNLNTTLTKTLAIIFSISLLTMTACQNAGQKKEKKEQDKELSVLYPNWAEGIAFTHLAKVALEDKGYDVNITPLEPGPIYASLAKGDADLFFDAWLPHTHKDYWEKYGDQLVKLGESFSNGTTGLVVPTYVDFVESIENLNEYKDRFDGKIIGIGSGAGIHANTEKAIKEYNLDYKQVTSSGPAMVASLKKAVNEKEPIIITGWKPHHKWGKYDLKYLEDPKDIYPKDVCAILSRKGFKDDFPKAAKFAENFNLNENQLYDLMADIKDSNDTQSAALAWYKDHKKTIDGFYPSE
ncbi:MAG: glycine betaine ABC transporter substrate-binding protein [Bacteroidales bacterium]|nr:glycine betaine ABC transporter substrate-binding protein [Bacteroidales bacterium]MCF8338002.1 glycine betaine ABC transporter substrate-binding protein [Bacteroidales bacterium]